MCGLGAVDASSIFGWVRRTGTFTGVLLTFSLVSGLQLAQHNRDNCHFFIAVFPSQLEAMVGGSLVRTSVLSVDLGVGRTHLDHSLAHRIRVMGGCVIWVWWVPR